MNYTLTKKFILLLVILSITVINAEACISFPPKAPGMWVNRIVDLSLKRGENKIVIKNISPYASEPVITLDMSAITRVEKIEDREIIIHHQRENFTFKLVAYRPAQTSMILRYYVNSSPPDLSHCGFAYVITNEVGDNEEVFRFGGGTKF